MNVIVFYVTQEIGSNYQGIKFQSTVDHISNVLQSTADQQEEESQSNIDVGGPSQVLK
jgi:hypothetical protein